MLTRARVVKSFFRFKRGRGACRASRSAPPAASAVDLYCQVLFVIRRLASLHGLKRHLFLMAPYSGSCTTTPVNFLEPRKYNGNSVQLLL